MDLAFINSKLLFLLALVPLFWCMPGALRDWKHSLIRSLVAIALIVALARPVLISRNDAAHFVFVLDESASTSRWHENARQTLREKLEKLPTDSTTTLVHLGDRDAGELRRDFPQLRIVSLRDDRSSISAAMATAIRAIPTEARGAITIISDGMATDQRWAGPLQAISRRQIPVHSIVLPRKDDVYPIVIQTQQPLRVGETARVRVGLVGNSSDLLVRLRNGDDTLAQAAKVVCRGRTNVMLEFEPEKSGFIDVVAEIVVADGSDDDTSNNSLTRSMAVQDPLRVLYFGQRVTGARTKFERLVGNGFEFVEFPRGNASPANDSAILKQADVVVLDDVSAAALPSDLQRSIVRAVNENGVGLLMSGGMSSFGPGGFHKTPLADILPVEFIQKEEKRDPSTTLVVIIDTSGSMSGQRVQLAKEVARLSIRRLLPHDKVGIVEFYGAKRWAAPIQPASNSIELQRAINRMDAGGGTVILPAIEESFYALQNIQTRYKHVLVLTDGGVEQGAFEPLLRKMSDKGINVSTVLVGGSTHSEFLVNIANWGKGRFYSVSNRFSLPEVILKQPTTARIPAYRPGQHVLTTHGGPGWWGRVNRTTVPALAGYVETRPRPRVQPLIQTQEGRHPILASWRRGLGRVSVFTSEPTGPGTSPWRDWKDYGALMGRVLRRTARNHTLPYEFALERRDDQLIVTATRLIDIADEPWAALANPAVDKTVTAVDFRPGDPNASPLEFKPLTPDRYQATTYYDPQQSARISAGISGPSTSVWRLASAARGDVSAETQVDPQLAIPFAQWAMDTGGSSVNLDVAEQLDLQVGGRAETLTVVGLSSFLMLLALLLYFSDLLYRRWPRPIAS